MNPRLAPSDPFARSPVRRTGLFLFWIVMAGFAFRLGLCAVTQGLHSPPDPALGLDHVQYERIARYLVEGKGYKMHEWESPSALRPPGMPFLIAAIYAVFGKHYMAVRILLSLLGALTALPVFFLARRLLPVPWALGIAAVLAFDPAHAYYSTHFFSETPWTLLMTLVLCLGVRQSEGKSVAWAAAQGAVLGAASLLRPAAFMFPFIWIGLDLLAGLFSREGSALFIRRLARHATLLAVMMSVILPWSFRNQRVMGEFVLFSTHGGSTFYGAHNRQVLENPALTGRWLPYELIPDAADMKGIRGEMEREHECWKRGNRFVREHLADMPRLVFWKFVRLLQPNPGTPNRLFNWVVGSAWGLLLPFAAAGLLLLIPLGRASPAALGLWATLLTLAAHTVLLYGDHRFRISIEPALVVLAVLGAWRLWEWVQRFQRFRTTNSG